MRAFFKPIAMMTASVATVSLLSACGPKTPEQLITGTWVQSEAVTMTDNGATVSITDSKSVYKKDGTSNGNATMTIEGSPVGDLKFTMNGKGNWSMADGVLTEKAVDADIESDSDNDIAKAITMQMKAQLENAPETKSEIIKLTKDELIVRDMQSDITMTYRRK